jgi:hypothetical protein
VKAQPIGKYRFSQCQASGWTKRTMVASKKLRLPHNFDFSKNREYTALRIAGGKRKRRIENTLLMDSSAPPKDVATGRRITPSTTRSKLIAPSGASRNRNDNQFLICRKVDTKREVWRRGCPSATWPSFWRFRGQHVLPRMQGMLRRQTTTQVEQPQRHALLDLRSRPIEMKILA